MIRCEARYCGRLTDRVVALPITAQQVCLTCFDEQRYVPDVQALDVFVQGVLGRRWATEVDEDRIVLVDRPDVPLTWAQIQWSRLDHPEPWLSDVEAIIEVLGRELPEGSVIALSFDGASCEVAASWYRCTGFGVGESLARLLWFVLQGAEGYDVAMPSRTTK